MTAVRQFGMYVLRVYWERRTYKTAMMLGLVTSLIGLAQFILLGKFIENGNTFAGINAYGGNIISFLLSGSVFTGFVAVSLSAFSMYLQQEQQLGTLESVLVSPISLTRLMLFPGLAGLIGTSFGSAVMIGLFGMIFGIAFSVNLLGVIAMLSLLVVTLGSFGLAGCGILLVTKKGDPVKWLVTTLTTLLSGVMFPLAMLPGWLQGISSVLPTTQALDGLRLALLKNAGIAELLPSLGNLALWTAVVLPVGLLTLRTGLLRARAGGTVGEL